MKLLSFAPALLLVALAAGVVHGRHAPAGDNPVAVRAIDAAFFRTQNLRAGEGLRNATHLRKPGIPTIFHVQRTEDRDAMSLAAFAADDETGLWSVAQGDPESPIVPAGSLYYADRAGTRPAGYSLTTASGDGLPSLAKTDVRYLAGKLKGVSYQSDVAVSESGAGTINAIGAHPSFGKYTMVGCWQASSAGSWSQRWDLPDGSWETDAYRNRKDGASVLKVSTSEGTDLELTFGTDLSGQGTVTGKVPGLPAKLAWDNEGTGTVTWADGSTTDFEDWKFGERV